MKYNQINTCPCCSGKAYADCCKPYHEGRATENALALMRSRYSAYALNLPDYIIKTTHVNHPQYNKNIAAWKDSIIQFSKMTTFKKLEILEFKPGEKIATVTFTAHLIQGNKDATFTEISLFEKMEENWFYLNGQILK